MYTISSKGTNLPESLKAIITEDSTKDTAEIKFDPNIGVNGGGYTTDGQKPTGYLSFVKLFFRAVFRSRKDSDNNKKVYDKLSRIISGLGNDNSNASGTSLNEKFWEHFETKNKLGSPLTKGALVEFLVKENIISIKADPKEPLLSDAATNKAATTQDQESLPSQKEVKAAETEKTDAIKAAERNQSIKFFAEDIYNFTMSVKGSPLTVMTQFEERFSKGRSEQKVFVKEMQEKIRQNNGANTELLLNIFTQTTLEETELNLRKFLDA